MTKIIKKDSTIVEFDKRKIIDAVTKSANRVMVKLTDKDFSKLIEIVKKEISDKKEISVLELHNVVEISLEKINPKVATSYKDYRNYKKDFVGMLDNVYKKVHNIMYLGDKENSNSDSALVSTKRSLMTNELSKELYIKFFLNSKEKLANDDGYIYIHDMGHRLSTLNCCLFDIQKVMTDGFEMSNIWYNEPKTIDTACDVLGDVILMASSNQYGGFSMRVEDALAPYVEKSYNKHLLELTNLVKDVNGELNIEFIEKKALEKTKRELEQGIQGLEYKLNSVGTSRGDFAFVTFAIGLGTSKFEKMISEAVLNVRMGGQGKEGKKKQVLFPKIVFLYDEDLHGEGKEMEDLFNLGIECSSKSMYPDWLSLTGEGYVPEMYKKYKRVVYPMG